MSLSILERSISYEDIKNDNPDSSFSSLSDHTEIEATKLRHLPLIGEEEVDSTVSRWEILKKPPLIVEHPIAPASTLLKDTLSPIDLFNLVLLDGDFWSYIAQETNDHATKLLTESTVKTNSLITVIWPKKLSRSN